METDTGEEYFFNAMTNVTSWELPEELKGIPEGVLRAPAAPQPPPQQQRQAQMQMHAQMQMQMQMQMMQQQMMLQQQQQQQMTGKRSISMPGMLQPPAKVLRSVEEEARARGMSPEDVAFERRLRILRGETAPETSGGRAAEEERRRREEEREARERAAKKEREEEEKRELAKKVKVFHELLTEMKVTQFTMWDSIVTKLAKDERFTLLPTMGARKEAFEAYARGRATARKVEKAQAAKTLAALVEEAVKKEDILEVKEFEKRYGKDERLKKYSSLSAKEIKEAFEKVAGPIREARLKEKNVDRAEGRHIYVGLLQECEWIRHDSHWSDVRRRLRKDSARYSRCGLASEEKEDLFYDHLKRLQKARERERKLRNLEDEARRRRERESRELEHRRRVRERTEAIENLKCVYEEMVKKPMRWEEVEERLCAMPRFTTRVLGEREKREILSEHLEHLGISTRRQFIALLESMPGVTLDSTFAEVETALGLLDDSRAQLLDEEGRKEAVDSYTRRLVADAARQFKALLENDVSKITPARSGPSFDKALRLMRRDKRWKALDGHAHVRDQLIMEFIDVGAQSDSDDGDSE